MTIEPKGTTIFTPSMAESFGREAHKDGLPKQFNPFDQTIKSDAYASWNAGWDYENSKITKG